MPFKTTHCFPQWDLQNGKKFVIFKIFSEECLLTGGYVHYLFKFTDKRILMVSSPFHEFIIRVGNKKSQKAVLT